MPPSITALTQSRTGLDPMDFTGPERINPVSPGNPVTDLTPRPLPANMPDTAFDWNILKTMEGQPQFTYSGRAIPPGEPPAVGGTETTPPSAPEHTSPGTLALNRFLRATLPGEEGVGDANYPGEETTETPNSNSASRYPLPPTEGTTVAPPSNVQSAAGEPPDQTYTDWAATMDQIINETTPEELAREAGSGPQRRGKPKWASSAGHNLNNP